MRERERGRKREDSQRDKGRERDHDKSSKNENKKQLKLLHFPLFSILEFKFSILEFNVRQRDSYGVRGHTAVAQHTAAVHVQMLLFLQFALVAPPCLC